MHPARFASASPFRAFQAVRLFTVLGVILTGLACGSANSETSLAAAQQQPLVEVFVTDWCPYCQRLEAFLKENEVVYERKNIEQDAEARAEHQALGGGGIPLTRINGREVIRGFKPKEIARAIGLGEPKQDAPKQSSVQSSSAPRMRPSASLSPSRKASAASCLLSPMSVTRTS
jgi:glutaredoxin